MIQAIETVYNGYRFRSRLEARWAVFFDALGVRYEYEKEGFELGGGLRYLPDFWLPDQKCWIEIKPTAPLGEDNIKAMGLAALQDKPVYIFAGEPWPDTQWDNLSGHAFLTHANYFPGKPPTDDANAIYVAQRYRWCECPVCGAVELYKPDTDGCNACMHIECLWRYTSAFPHGTKCRNPFIRSDRSPRLMAAYTSARQARFEHGQQPRIKRLPPRRIDLPAPTLPVPQELLDFAAISSAEYRAGENKVFVSDDVILNVVPDGLGLISTTIKGVDYWIKKHAEQTPFESTVEDMVTKVYSAVKPKAPGKKRRGKSRRNA